MKTKKPLILLASMVLILLVGVVGTLALLIMQSGPVENTFVPGNVSVEVQENFNNTEKKDVQIRNTGNVDAYIRVAIIPTWEDDEGNPVGVSASLSDLDITWTNNNWQQGADGFWYYTSPVSAGGSTDNLIDSASVKTANGYHMNLQILAQGIQADGVDSKGQTPVELAWSSGVSGVGYDGTLSVITR